MGSYLHAETKNSSRNENCGLLAKLAAFYIWATSRETIRMNIGMRPSQRPLTNLQHQIGSLVDSRVMRDTLRNGNNLVASSSKEACMQT